MRMIDANWLKENLGKVFHQECDHLYGMMQLIDEAPTLTPPNEPEYREYTCPNCHHTWLEDRDATDYPEYCPGCGEPLNRRAAEDYQQRVCDNYCDFRADLARVTAERDAAVEAVKNMAEYIVCAGRVDYYLCDEISQEHHLKYQPKNDGNYDNEPCYKCIVDWFLQGHEWQENCW